MRLVSNKFHHKMWPTGDFGVEVEVEAASFATMPHLNCWKSVHDGSLRGESAEFVFRKPLPLDETISEVVKLYSYLKECGIKDSGRAGVHVHVNVNTLTVVQLLNLIAMWMIVEEAAVRWCGPSRKGNLFCLTSSEACGNLLALVRAIAENDFAAFDNGDRYRYAALNLCSLWKYGSIEFRCLGTPTTHEPIVEWVLFLDKLVSVAKAYDNPASLILAMSAGGYKEFVKRVLPSPVVDSITDKELREGVNNAQMVAFAADWGRFDQTKTIGGIEFPIGDAAIEPMEDM